MPARTSKESSDRLKAARFVLSVIFQRGQEISDLLVGLFRPHLREGDPEPEFFGTVVAIGRRMSVAIDTVIAADHRLFAANAAVDAERTVRRKKAAELFRLISGLRGACNALFVDLQVQRFGFDARTAQDPAPLVLQAERVAEHLENGEIVAEYVFEGDDFDPGKYAGQVREKATGLRTCLDHMADLQRDAEKALLHKRDVTDEYDSLFGDGARTFESYCRMAGETELADRVRPSETRPGVTQVPPNGEEEPTEASAAERSAAEESVGEESVSEESVATEAVVEASGSS